MLLLTTLAFVFAEDPFEQLRKERAERVTLAYDARIVIAHERLATYCKVSTPAPLAYKHLGTFADAIAPLKAIAAECPKPKRTKPSKRAPLQVLAAMKQPTSETAAAAISLASTTVDILGLADALWGDALAQALATSADAQTLAEIERRMGYGERPNETTFEAGLAFTALHGDTVSDRREAVARFVEAVLPEALSLPQIEAEVARTKGAPVFDDEGGKISREAMVLRARLMSAVTLELIEALGIISDMESATEIAHALGTGETPWGKRFSKWLTAELSLNSSAGAPPEVMLVAISAPLFFVPTLVDDRVEAASALGAEHRHNLRRSALRMLKTLDERPTRRLIAAWVLDDLLADIEQRELVERSVYGDSAHAVRFAGFARDIPGFWRAFKRDPLKAESFDWLIRLATEDIIPRAQAIDAMDRSVARMSAKHADAVYEYARYLAKTGENAHGEWILARYLQTKPEDVMGANIRAQYARFLMRLGEKERALALATEAARDAGSAFTIVMVAETLQANGRGKDAIAAIKHARQRYRHAAWLFAYVIDILLANDKEADLVADIASAKQWLTPSDWTFNIGRPLTRHFCPAGTAQADAFFRALAKAGINLDAQRLLWQIFHEECEGVLPIETLIDTMKSSGMAYQLPGLLDTHYVMKTALPEAAADKWLQDHLKPSPWNAPTMFMYRDDNQLWTLIEPSGNDEQIGAIWLFRAATLLRTPSAERTAKLEAFLAANPKNLYVNLIHYMMNVDADASFARFAAGDADRKCEAAFYASLKALALGDVKAAHEWLQLALQTNATKNLEYMMAHQSLQRIRTRQKALASLNADDFR